MLRTLIFAVVVLTTPHALRAQISGEPGAGGVIRANALLPGDIVDISIWREEDLSGRFTVDESGTVVLPLIGARNVAGVSPQDLRDDLAREYSVYLQNPSVNITLFRRITVAGEVRAPGLYTVDATVSIADLIARAGGLTPDGDTEKIELARDGGRFELDLNGATVVGEAGIRSGDRLFVGKRSWFARNLSSVVGIVSIVSNVVLIATR